MRRCGLFCMVCTCLGNHLSTFPLFTSMFRWFLNYACPGAAAVDINDGVMTTRCATLTAFDNSCHSSIETPSFLTSASVLYNPPQPTASESMAQRRLLSTIPILQQHECDITSRPHRSKTRRDNNRNTRLLNPETAPSTTSYKYDFWTWRKRTAGIVVNEGTAATTTQLRNYMLAYTLYLGDRLTNDHLPSFRVQWIVNYFKYYLNKTNFTSLWQIR